MEKLTAEQLGSQPMILATDGLYIGMPTRIWLVGQIAPGYAASFALPEDAASRAVRMADEILRLLTDTPGA
jgi:hypothetical protein